MKMLFLLKSSTHFLIDSMSYPIPYCVFDGVAVNDYKFPMVLNTGGNFLDYLRVLPVPEEEDYMILRETFDMFVSVPVDIMKTLKTESFRGWAQDIFLRFNASHNLLGVVGVAGDCSPGDVDYKDDVLRLILEDLLYKVFVEDFLIVKVVDPDWIFSAGPSPDRYLEDYLRIIRDTIMDTPSLPYGPKPEKREEPVKRREEPVERRVSFVPPKSSSIRNSPAAHPSDEFTEGLFDGPEWTPEFVSAPP